MQFQAYTSGNLKRDFRVYETFNYQKITAPDQNGKGTFNGYYGEFAMQTNRSTGAIAQVTEINCISSEFKYEYAKLSYNASYFGPKLSSDFTTLLSSNVVTPVTVNLQLDVYGYPISINSAEIKYCNGGSSTLSENSPIPPPQCQDLSYYIGNKYLTDGTLRPGYRSENGASEYTVTDLTVSAVLGSSKVTNLLLTPGVGFVYVNISLGQAPTPFFQASYTTTKAYANVGTDGFYTLNVPLKDMLGNPAFTLVIKFKSTVSGGKVVKPLPSAFTFPDLKKMIEAAVPPPNSPVLMGLSLVAGNDVWNYADIVPY